MEIIQHILGVCSDSHSHLDLMDLLLNNTPIHDLIVYFNQMFKNIFNKY